MNGLEQADVERLKQEILSEIRKEVQKMKIDIIEGKLTPVKSNRRVFI